MIVSEFMQSGEQSTQDNEKKTTFCGTYECVCVCVCVCACVCVCVCS